MNPGYNGVHTIGYLLCKREGEIAYSYEMKQDIATRKLKKTLKGYIEMVWRL